ncbi:Tyrosine recombinase XerC [Fervidicola ferrireducens]|uniref:Tyrosine recombinase XerC n=1 Tax=Fervidicola ferrireducens TaxID=520764 RepID=A0A140L9P2_9FIRM|nr:tyrosine-type recombinase/integrase [Fervidicola ferrireducens]KXG77267.1 Tyrosine recombinase XerC [Fervidicola ferrireducens]
MLELYQKYLSSKGKSLHTVKNYISDLRQFAKWFEESTEEKFSPDKITEIDVRGYRSYLMGIRNLKPASIKRKLEAIRKFLDWAVKQEIITKNPAKEVEAPPAVTLPPKSLSEKEFLRLRRSFYKEGNERDIAIFEVLANTGIRVSELCSLKLSDIQISERKGKLIVRYGKGQKYREVPLNSDARKALNEYLKSRADENNERLFLGERGPLTPSGVFRIIKRYARDAGVEVSPHQLRHTFARRLLQSGADIVTVQQILGHANLNTTAVYLKPDYGEQEEAVEKISKLHL